MSRTCPHRSRPQFHYTCRHTWVHCCLCTSSATLICTHGCKNNNDDTSVICTHGYAQVCTRDQTKVDALVWRTCQLHRNVKEHAQAILQSSGTAVHYMLPSGTILRSHAQAVRDAAIATAKRVPTHVYACLHACAYTHTGASNVKKPSSVSEPPEE